MSSDAPELCGRCARELHGPGETEQCLFCEGPMCLDCWDAFGCCPHPGADEWQARMNAATTPEERAKLITELGPIRSPKPEWRRREH